MPCNGLSGTGSGNAFVSLQMKFLATMCIWYLDALAADCATSRASAMSRCMYERTSSSYVSIPNLLSFVLCMTYFR